MANSKVSSEQWVDYAKSMVLGFSFQKSACYCKVYVKTSFYMRYRLLDAVCNFQGIGNVSGIVEMYETFLHESFIGNHKKSDFKMPRNARKRDEQAKKRNISIEQVCIAIAIYIENNIVFEMVHKGLIGTTDLEHLFKDRLDSDSLICTDSHPSYKKFVKKYA